MWQPIDTAPNDGNAILIGRPTPYESEEMWHVVRWSLGDDYWVVHDGKSDHVLRGPEPTHWMPLTPLPSKI